MVYPRVSKPKVAVPKLEFGLADFHYSDGSRLELSLTTEPENSYRGWKGDRKQSMSEPMHSMKEQYWRAIMFHRQSTVRLQVTMCDAEKALVFPKGSTVRDFVERVHAFYHSRPTEEEIEGNLVKIGRKAFVRVGTHSELMDGAITCLRLLKWHRGEDVYGLDLRFY